MACYKPIPAYQRSKNAPPKLWPQLGLANLVLPCGTCLGCKTARATHWANRCDHEAREYNDNSFITLTYAPEHLPEESHLVPYHLELFLKRLRQRAVRRPRDFNRNHYRSIRYFACGEYGERNDRPHYHALAFNCTFTEREKIGESRGHALYTSPILRDLWPYGHSTFGEAKPGAANYIAQYSLKKQGNGGVDSDGVWKPQPFLRMSTKPPIGQGWLDDYKTDIRKGFFVRDGRPQKIPRTYMEKLKKTDPQLAEEIQYTSYEFNKGREQQNLAAAEEIHRRRKQLTERRTV